MEIQATRVAIWAFWPRGLIEFDLSLNTDGPVHTTTLAELATGHRANVSTENKDGAAATGSTFWVGYTTLPTG